VTVEQSELGEVVEREHNDRVIERTAGEGRYARVEREQRWLLRAQPDGLDRPVSIVDRYITDTRLRLRRMEDGAVVVYKLAQKVRADPQTPQTVQLTNIYLSEQEYATLRRLGGAEIRKTRWRWSPAERGRLAVDEFQGDLTGLVLAEVELAPDEPELPAPPYAVADVTDDERFCGGTLALTTVTELTSLLERFGPRR
jgi:CYTH domain-containing protein